MATTGASLQPIYDRLHAASAYHPMSADTFADWSVEAGDVVSVSRDGTAYQSPLHNTRIVWRGSPQVTINSTGKEKRDTIARMSKQKYGRSGAGMSNDQTVYHDLHDEHGYFHSEMDYTASVLRVEFESGITSAEAEFASQLEMTSSYLQAQFMAGISDAEVEFASQLEMTASHLEVEFLEGITSAEVRFASELEMTSSFLQAELVDSMSAMYGELELTASHLQTEFTDGINGVHSEIVQTASLLQTEFTDGINGVHSEVVQTASSWDARVSGVVDGQGNVTAASIAVAINRNGSSAYINADHVYLTGTSTLAGQVTVQDGSLLVQTALLVSGTTGGNVTINNGKVSASTHQVNSGGELLFVGTDTGEHYEIDANILKSMVKSFSVNNNVLTLTPFYGEPVNFSKATALSGAWSSGTLTVTASPQGETYVRTIIQDLANADWGPGYVNVPINAQWTSGASTYTESTGREVYVPFSDRLENKGTVTVNGTYTASAGYIGISSITVDVSGSSTINNARSRFNSSSGGYYIEAYDSSGSGAPSVPGSSLTYRMVIDGSLNTSRVQIQDSSGNRIANTPELNVGTLYTDGQNSVDAVRAASWTGTGSTRTMVVSPSAGTGASANVIIGLDYVTSTTTTGNLRTRDTGSGDIQVIREYPYSLTQSGTWSGNKTSVSFNLANTAIATISVDAGSIYDAGVADEKALVKTRFGSASGSYYIEAYENVTGSPSISGSSTTYKLGTSGSTTSTKVQIQNSSGTKIANTAELNVGSLYTDGRAQGWEDAYAKVSLPTTNTSTSSCTVQTPAATSSSNPLQNSDVFSLSVANNTADIKRAQNGGTAITVARITHNKYNSGRAAVNLANPTWNTVTTLTSSRTVTVSTTGRSDSSGVAANVSKSKTVHLTAGLWDSGSVPVYIRDGSTSGTIVAQNSVNLPAVSSTTWTNTTGRTWRADLTIGGVTRSSSAKNFNSYYYEGSAAVGLDDPTWNAITGSLPSNRTVTVSTTGRTNASGTAANLNKAVKLYLTASGLTVTMRTESTTGTAYASKTCSDSNLTAANIKNGVTIFGVTGTYSGSSIVPSNDIQIGSYTNTRADPGSSYVNASTMASVIRAAINNGNWFGFMVTINGISGQKYYKCDFT